MDRRRRPRGWRSRHRRRCAEGATWCSSAGGRVADSNRRRCNIVRFDLWVTCRCMVVRTDDCDTRRCSMVHADRGDARRYCRSPAAAPGRGCLPGEIGVLCHGQVLHRPADLRDRHRAPGHARRRIVDHLYADRAVPDHRAAVDPDHVDLRGRFRGDCRKHRCAGDRAADERARSSAVYLVEFRRLRHRDHDADLRGRNQS